MPKSNRRRRQIEIRPVWRDRVDRDLLLRAALAYAEQLAAQADRLAPRTTKEQPEADDD